MPTVRFSAEICFPKISNGPASPSVNGPRALLRRLSFPIAPRAWHSEPHRVARTLRQVQLCAIGVRLYVLRDRRRLPITPLIDFAVLPSSKVKGKKIAR